MKLFTESLLLTLTERLKKLNGEFSYFLPHGQCLDYPVKLTPSYYVNQYFSEEENEIHSL